MDRFHAESFCATIPAVRSSERRGVEHDPGNFLAAGHQAAGNSEAGLELLDGPAEHLGA